jgi:hypothetical protein
LDYPIGIAVFGSDLFVVNYGSNSIGEYTTSGATVNADLISGLSDPGGGIAVCGSDLFVVNVAGGYEGYGMIGEYTTSGAVVNASLVSGLYIPGAIAVSGSDLFVANFGPFGNGWIGEYTTSGATVNTSLFGLYAPEGIAVVVPEPATGSLLLIAGARAFMRRRRQQ